LDAKLASGRYTGKAGTAILNELFLFYDGMLRTTIPAIASRDTADFLLFQYDECQRVFHGEGIVDLEEWREWKEIEGTLRRAIKYMVQLACSEVPIGSTKIPKRLAVDAFDICVFCAESAANLAEMSERMHSTFPDQFFVDLDFSSTSDFVITIEENPRKSRKVTIDSRYSISLYSR